MITIIDKQVNTNVYILQHITLKKPIAQEFPHNILLLHSIYVNSLAIIQIVCYHFDCDSDQMIAS